MKQTLWCATLLLSACTSIEGMTLGSLPSDRARDGAIVMSDPLDDDAEEDAEERRNAEKSEPSRVVDAAVVDAAVDAGFDARAVTSKDAATGAHDAKVGLRLPWEDEDLPPLKLP